MFNVSDNAINYFSNYVNIFIINIKFASDYTHFSCNVRTYSAFLFQEAYSYIQIVSFMNILFLMYSNIVVYLQYLAANRIT